MRNALAFLIAAAIYVLLTFFIFFNYPEAWRKNRIFLAVVTLWRAVGLGAVVIVFTVFRDIPNEGVRHAIARIGSCYYITTTVQALLYFIRFVSSRTYRFIAERTGRAIRAQGERWLSDKRAHAIAFIALSFVIFFIGYFNIDVLRDTRYAVTVEAPSAEKELNICLIADIHAGAGTWENTYDDLAALIDASESDVLLIAGDAFDETTSQADIERLAWALGEIEPPRYGIYFVYGNHDSKVENWAAEQMRAMGATVLGDQMTVLGADIQLIGCMDPKHGAKTPEKLFADCAPDPDKPILVRMHRPKNFQCFASLGADLVMAGHTHGFNIPQFLGSPIFGDMYAGSEDYGGMTAITTSGVSAWGFHYKWPAVSEVVSIHVTFRQEGAA